MILTNDENYLLIMDICHTKDSSDISQLYSLFEFHTEKFIKNERDINILYYNIKQTETMLNNKINNIDYVTNFIILILLIILIIITIINV